MKPWEETWDRSGRFVDKLVDGGVVVGRVLVCTDHAPGASDTDRATLAAAAPDLYRALDALEWIVIFDEAGNEMRHECPSCDGASPAWVRDAGGVWQGHVGHREGCALNAALRKARGET